MDIQCTARMWEISARDGKRKDRKPRKIVQIKFPFSEFPGQVQGLKVSSSDSTSVTLTWKRPEAKDGSDVKGYEVEMRSSNNPNWTKCNARPIEVTTYTVKGLQAKETYFLRVRALSDSGPGEAVELEACVGAAPPVGESKCTAFGMNGAIP